ncbi:hypothetical protein CERSUDRAFT_114044 [Gelatoporia subvermispora B]|uniref:Uncharacterized protein n=1 Tax=Ceriporiopsis subvermispora (strain B) TaxID=914234 RepID=M2RFZ0_CERS8|nr:hypothetical protein CERSUDRAFT_114044 [Gelatoporia subvermispora B]
MFRTYFVQDAQQGQITRTGDTLRMRLVPGDAPQETVPYDLQPYISPEAWQARMRAVTNKGARWIHPKFDALFLILNFIVGIAVPVAVYYVALHQLTKNDKQTFDNDPFFDDRFDDDNDVEHYWDARLIAFGAWLGATLLFWVPMLLWKQSGKSQVNTMLERFEVEDRAVRDTRMALPTYRIRMPGIGAKALKLDIKVPPAPAMSSFQPGAQLPPYLVNPPAMPGYVPMASDPSWNAARGGVPMYDERDDKVPDYSGPTGDFALPLDEKRASDFEDVAV